MTTDHVGSFPHPAYARDVLEPAFQESTHHLFRHMIAANEAHVLMLAECGVLDDAHASALLRALGQVEAEGVETFAYTPSVEDLFFAVEGRLIELAGSDAGGNLQIARSRNDLAAGMGRMALRERLLEAQGQVLALRRALLDLAAAHVRTLMPGITHTQPAQPTTLAHLLLGVLGPLERDSERLAGAFARTNRSAFGVAAFTTTSFSIDRELTAALLGFDGLIENGYDAVGAGDHLLEAVQALVTSVAALSRFLYDLLVWARASENLLRIDDAFIQISSIMPQKRNPVVLEHIRVRIGWVYGDAAAVGTILHNAAFGDTNDVEDPIFVPLHRAFDAADMVYLLLTAVLETASFNVDEMARRAGEGSATTTALADALVRECRIPFRAAHTIVSRLVSRTLANGDRFDADLVNEVSAEVLGSAVGVTEAFVAEALDPWRFVEARTIPGGPAPETTTAAIAAARERLDADRVALAEAREMIAAADIERRHRIADLVG